MYQVSAFWITMQQGNTFIFGSAWARESVFSLELGTKTSEELDLKKTNQDINLAILIVQATNSFTNLTKCTS